MALSTKTRKRLQVAMANRADANELADAVDATDGMSVASLVSLGTPAAAIQVAFINGWQDGYARYIADGTWTNKVFKARQQFRNDIVINVVGDAPGAITITENVTAGTLTVHYKSATSTVAQVKAFVNANSALVTMVESSTSSDSSTPSSPGDDIVAQALNTTAPVVNVSEINSFFDPNNTTIVLPQPDVPRNLVANFPSPRWDGGKVFVTGVNALGEIVSETFDPVDKDMSSNVTGVVAWKQIIEITKELIPVFNINHADGVCNISLGNTLGMPKKMADSVMQVFVNGAYDSSATTDVPNSTITSSTTPDGATAYQVLFNYTI